MNIKPKLIEFDVLKKIIKTNKTTAENSVINNLFSYSCKGIVHVIKNYADFIFVLLFLFFVLYMRYKYNEQNKKVSGPNEIHVNYIRNKDIVNDKVYNIKDNVETDDNIDDNILSIIKKEINKLDDDNIELGAFDEFQNYSSY